MSLMRLTLEQLRRYAVARSLFTPTSLPKAIARLGFVQADPIRAPARAQDLTLRHRVNAYRAGDLEARYARLAVEEDFFVNYGFMPRATHHLMHPRTARQPWPAARHKQAAAVLDYVRAHGVVHPRQMDAHFDHGRVTNGFGGSGSATTHLLDDMHYRGLLRVAGREGGVRLYAARQAVGNATPPQRAMDALVDVIVNQYAPLPGASLAQLISLLCRGVPQWRDQRQGMLARAKVRLPSAVVEGMAWYWPANENPSSRRHRITDTVRLLAPFDPVVWDRRRFEIFWRWPYRFEAYTPAAKRVRGYYALPLLWRDQVIGWANVSAENGALQTGFGFVEKRPAEKAFTTALDDELQRMSAFLGLGNAVVSGIR
jgi:uncharacterized protein